MDLTGSIAETTLPLSAEIYGSIGEGFGSSAIDTIIGSAMLAPLDLLAFLAGFGADLGSTGGGA